MAEGWGCGMQVLQAGSLKRRGQVWTWQVSVRANACHTLNAKQSGRKAEWEERVRIEDKRIRRAAEELEAGGWGERACTAKTELGEGGACYLSDC